MFTGSNLKNFIGAEMDEIRKFDKKMKIKKAEIKMIQNQYYLKIISHDKITNDSLENKAWLASAFDGIKKVPTKKRLFLRIFLNTNIKLENNQLVEKAISENKLVNIKRTVKFGTNDIKPKTRIEVDTLAKWYDLLETDIYIGKRHFLYRGN